MSHNSKAYFDQTQWGESRWWSWGVGFWFIVIGWILAQVIFTSPITTIISETNPELVEQFNQLAEASLMSANPVLLGILMLGFMVSTGAGIFFWILNRALKGTGRVIMGWLTGLSIIISLGCLFRLIPMMNDPEANNMFMAMIGESPIAYALMLATFPGTLVGVYLVQKFLHQRTITSLHTAAAKIDWGRILYAIIITWAVMGTITFVLHITGISPVKSTFDPSRFFGFALATLLFIPLQSATEEIVFRGYLNQALGHILKNKWIVFIITSVLFAAMHLSNPEATSGAEKGGLMHLMVMSQYFLFGFILCIIVYYEGGLEAAIGVHAANNMFAGIFVNYEGSVLPTPSLYLAGINPKVDVPAGLLTLTLIAYLLYRSRKQIVIPETPPGPKLNETLSETF